MSVVERIQQQLNEHPVVLYMKGTPDFPQCGFSARAVHILRQLNVDFKAINVLEDSEIRQGIKAYGDWPTIPQLYVQGELVGGSDIMLESYENGELKSILDQALSA